MKLSKFTFLLAAALLAPISHAQTMYDKIEAGATLSGSIKLGSFSTPFPLPPGQWKVLKVKVDQIALSNGQSTPRWVYFLLETSKQSAIHSLLVSITPEASSINWGNLPCKGKNNNSFLVETLDTTVNSIEFFCGVATKQIPFKAMVDSSSTSTSPFVKDFFGTLVQEPDLPKEVVEIYLRGSKDKNKQYAYTAFVAADVSDPSVAETLRIYVSEVGSALRMFLNSREKLLPTLAIKMLQ